MSTGDISNLQELFSNAQDEGLSAHAAGILVNNLSTATTAGAQGASVDDLAGDEVTLFVEVLDKTGSMAVFTDDVIFGYNEHIEALVESKAADSILMSTWVFDQSSTLLHGYLPLTSVPRLDRSTYRPGGNTALYDAILDAFTSVVAYSQSLRDAGVRTKIVVVVVSDGDDNASYNTATSVATVAQELLNQEYYTLAFIAFGMNGNSVASRLGFPSENTKDFNADRHDLRLAFGTISKSVIRASQTTIGQQGSQSFFS